MTKARWTLLAAACLALAASGCTDTPKRGSPGDAMQDPMSQPDPGTPRTRAPSQGANRTGDAMQDPAAQPPPGTPRY